VGVDQSGDEGAVADLIPVRIVERCGGEVFAATRVPDVFPQNPNGGVLDGRLRRILQDGGEEKH
jgi:hypothetical protein